jgi:F-type H+-transporting ATPase subunit a
MPTMLAESPLSHVVEHTLVRIGPVEFTNHMLMVLEAAVVLSVGAIVAARQPGLAPGKLRNLFESICVFLRDEIVYRSIGKEHGDKYVKFIWTLFFFILTCNLLGMVPSSSIVTLFSSGRFQHYGGTATANIYVTGSLAGMAFLMVHVSGVRQQGLVHYFKNFIPHVPWPLAPIMYVLELIGAFVKPFALSIRLFANMLGGHVVLGALLGMAAAAGSIPVAGVTIIGCAALSVLELLVAFLQAYIFTFLAAMFIGQAVAPEH